MTESKLTAEDMFANIFMSSRDNPYNYERFIADLREYAKGLVPDEKVGGGKFNYLDGGYNTCRKDILANIENEQQDE